MKLESVEVLKIGFIMEFELLVFDSVGSVEDWCKVFNKVVFVVVVFCIIVICVFDIEVVGVSYFIGFVVDKKWGIFFINCYVVKFGFIVVEVMFVN